MIFFLKNKTLLKKRSANLENYREKYSPPPIYSRGILIHTRAYRNDQLEGNQNRMEEEFLDELRKIFPEDIKVIILADRGFGRVSFFRKLEELKFEYIGRVTMNNWIHSYSYAGLIKDVKIKSELRKDFGQVIFTKEHK